MTCRNIEQIPPTTDYARSVPYHIQVLFLFSRCNLKITNTGKTTNTNGLVIGKIRDWQADHGLV